MWSDKYHKFTNPLILLDNEKIKQIASGWCFALVVRENNDICEIRYKNIYEIRYKNIYENEKYLYEIKTIMSGEDLPSLKRRSEASEKICFSRFSEDIRQIVCGNSHAIILKTNDEIWVYGDNHFGQLGLGKCDNKIIEPQFLMRDKIREIACGQYHTVILKANNDVLVF